MSKVSSWRQACAAAGVDPALVEQAARLYRLHRDHARSRGGTALDLRTWFGFYAQENAALLSADRLVVDGCSVDESAVAPPTVARTAAILRLLELRGVEPEEDGACG